MRVLYGLSAFAAVAWVSLALAQVRDPVRPAAPAAGARPAAEAAAQAWTADQQIAACLYYGCRNEVEFAKFAQDKAQSEEVRQFAERMAAEHTEACDKLAKFAGNAVTLEARLDALPGAARREERREERIERREERRDEAAPRPEAVPPRDAAAPRAAADPPRSLEIEAPGGTRVQIQPGARPGLAAGGAGGLNWVAIHKQFADQCLATFKQELAAKEGPEFDRCFMGGQIMGHLKALDEIKVLRNYASPELRAELDACSQGCAEHIKEAKALALKLEGQTPRVSRRPEGGAEATKPE
jgi:predicted outer membrane protein